MSTEKQIEANRQNAQASSGPVTEEGKQISSQNAIKHGFTGLSLKLAPEEHDAYFVHVMEYMSQYKPANYSLEQLVQQLADLDWSLHQINVQQLNTISLMNAVHAKDDGEDPTALAKVIGGLTRTLNTLNLYETRRRRAAREIKLELEAAQQAYKERLAWELPNAVEMSEILKESGKTFEPHAFGFVCSTAQIKNFADAQSLLAKAKEAVNAHLAASAR